MVIAQSVKVKIMKKLDHGQRHIMKLIDRDKGPDGWTKVSEALFPHMMKSLPVELVELEKTDTGRRARLTGNGNCVLYAMQWL